MNARAQLTVTMLLALALANGANGQEKGPKTAPPSTGPARRWGTTESPPQDLRKVQSPALTTALADSEALWTFLTDPATPYLERLAAAVQGAEKFPMKMLPRLMAARLELQTERSMHHWGVAAHPLESNPWMIGRRLPRDGFGRPLQAERTIMGHPWTLPAQWLDCPLTWNEQAAAPWPWQVEKALETLWGGLVPRYQSDRTRAEEYLAAALTMLVNNDREAHSFLEATAPSQHFQTVAVLARWRQLSLDPRYPGAGSYVAATIAEVGRLWDDPQARAIAEVITVDILEKSPSVEAKRQGAYNLRSFLAQWRNGRETPTSESAAAVMATAKLAMDPKSGSNWDRLYCYVFSVCEGVSQPPFKPDRFMRPDSDQVPVLLEKFAAWFHEHEAQFQAEAAQAEPALKAARAALDAAAARLPLPAATQPAKRE